MSGTIYFIVPYPFAEAPSQRFRFEQYIPDLEAQGYRIEVHPFYDYKSWRTLYTQGNALKKAWGIVRSFGKRLVLLFKLRKADHIFIHREMAHVGPPILEWLVTKVFRRKYIYDFDDAIWLPNYSETNARFHRLKAYWKVKYCIKWAAKVTAGNEYLASYARQFNSNVEIIPTTIDTENHHNVRTDHQRETPIIGWTGTHTTSQYLEDIIPVLKKLEEKYDFIFRVISNEDPKFDLKSFEFVKWTKETEIYDLQQFTIGIMPLRHDIWSEGKCGFKGLQYMSLGIVAVMSPVGVNTSIVHDGINGYLAETPEEWEERLALLLTDAALRTKIGEAGRITIEERYSVKAFREKYTALFR
jgi:glycosyltransferase involved in cell wall biosynthesis